MAKVSLNDVTNFSDNSAAVATTNANNAAIETAMENTLSRDGTSPNAMNANLDMNSNRILNLPTPTLSTDIITKAYGDAHYGGAALEEAEEAADEAATSALEAANSAASAQADAAAAAQSAIDAQESAEEAAMASGGVKISDNDTTSNVLEDKLLAGLGIVLSTQNEGGNETRTVTVDFADQTQGESGTDTDNVMNSLRTKQYVDGRLASQAEAQAGSNNTKLMTPLRVAEAIAALTVAGKLKAVHTTVKTDTFSTTSSGGTFVDITGLSKSITPQSSSSKFLLFAQIMNDSANGNGNAFQFHDGTNPIQIGDAASSRSRTSFANTTGALSATATGIAAYAPGNTTTFTLKVRMYVTSGTGYINRTNGDTDSATFYRGASIIGAIEYTD